MKHSLFITAFVCTTAISNLYAQTDALKILPNGNVGVGTEAPTEKLQVDGNVKANGRFMDKTGLVMPVGTILPYAGSTAPPGWLLCNGAAYSISGDQKDLFAALGYTYGNDGTTAKFKVPDLYGTFIQGAGPEAVGTWGYPDQHSHSVTMPQRSFGTEWAGDHNHFFPRSWYNRGMDKGAYTGIDIGGQDVTRQSTENAGGHWHVVNLSAYTMQSASSSDRNRPKWIALNYIIKY